MTAPTITDYLKYANLQMAAEAFIRNERTGELATRSQDVIAALIRGNDHSSKFTETEANKFAADWEVVDQRANTNTGFSGTLFRRIRDDAQTGAKAGELVLSFRSTEFIDDAARDNLATNTDEIKNTGWAFGQIADMEAWYAELKQKDLAPGTSFSVTGYSLGGHLATAFNLLRREEYASNPSANPVSQVVTFNGAGVGKITDGTSLTKLIADFQNLRTHPDAVLAQLDPALRELYAQLRDGLNAGALTVAAAKTLLTNLATPFLYNEAQANVFTAQKLQLTTALTQIADLQSEAARVPTLHSGDETQSKPQNVPLTKIEAASLDYRMAVLLSSQHTTSDTLIGGVANAYLGKKYLVPPLTNQYDIVGDTNPSAVSNSQWHYGTDVRLPIEDQPLYRGGIAASVLGATLDYGDIKLLVDGYAFKDFGDTHSLVLLIDSLNVQNTLLRLDPNMTQSTLNTFFKAASYLKRQDGDLAFGQGQGLSEGDALENLLNALGSQLNGPENWTAIYGNPTGNTWAKVEDSTGTVDGNTIDYAGRTRFYQTLQTLTGSPAYQALQGQLTLSLASANLQSTARDNFAAFTALYSLSPFVLSAANGDAYALETLLGQAWGTTYADWQHDRALTPEQRTDEAIISDDWLTDRARFLGYWLQATERNTNTLTGVTESGLANTDQLVIQDLASLQNVTVMSDGAVGSPVPTGKESQYLRFGTQTNDRLDGGKLNDHLYGMAGSDVLTGGLNSDRLEGGDGMDVYRFTTGDGQDTVRDSDHRGLLQRDNTLITFAYQRNANVWEGETDGQRFTATRDGSRLMLDFADSAPGAGDADRFTLENFDFERAEYQAGDLGLRLVDALAAAPTASRSYFGDTADYDNDPTQDGIQRIYDANGNVVRADGQNGRPNTVQADRADTFKGSSAPETERFDLGDGNDTVQADSGQATGGADLIDAGAGRDRIDSDAGNDRIAGGSGGDILSGGAGDDLMYAEGKLADAPDVITAIQNGEQQSGVAGEEELLIGNAGRDTLIGDAQKDTLLGGADSDLLIGGGNDDTLLGDATLPNAVQTRLDWQVQRTVSTNADGSHTYHARFKNVDVQSDGVSGDADTLIGGAGDDWEFAGGGDDLALGGSGKDVIFGEAGSDILQGGDDDDVLIGDNPGVVSAEYEGSDVLDGGAGNDILQADGGADFLIGGKGDDTLVGGAGKDTYLINADDGIDTIIDSDTGADASVLIFGAGVDQSHIKLGLGSLLLDMGDGNAVHIANFNPDDPLSNPSVERFDFADGTSLSWDDLLARGFDLDGANTDDTIIGTTLTDRITGGQANDVLVGLAGDDVYLLNLGDGQDTIIDREGLNRIRFGDGITAASLVIQNIVQWNEETQQNESITRMGYGTQGDAVFVHEALLGALDGFDFADGSALSWADAIANHPALDVTGRDTDDRMTGTNNNDRLAGGDGMDTLSGGAGNDTLSGGAGDDVYLFNLGDGQDTIIDEGSHNHIVFGAGISASELHADWITTVDGQRYLKLSFNAEAEAADALYIKDGTLGRIADYTFDDGNVLTHADLLASLPPLTLSGSADADVIIGSAQDDWLEGLAGMDTLDGGAGNDTLDGGAGSDTLAGGDGVDTYLLGYGSGLDTVIEQSGQTSRIQLTDGLTVDDLRVQRQGDELTLSIAGTQDGLTLSGYYAGAAGAWTISSDGAESGIDLDILIAQAAASAASQDVFASARDDYRHAAQAMYVASLLSQGYARAQDGSYHRYQYANNASGGINTIDEAFAATIQWQTQS